MVRLGLIEEGERNLCSLLCCLFMSEEISLEEDRQLKIRNDTREGGKKR